MRNMIAKLLTWLLGRIENDVVKPVAAPVEHVIEEITAAVTPPPSTQIIDTGSATLPLGLTTAAGNAVDAAVTLASSDPTIATAALSADGKSAVVTAAGKIGSATITATAGALQATYLVTVVAGPAASLTFGAVAAS
jgi:uncharacterized protein YjdB